MSNSKLVSVIVPAHNEQGNITPLSRKIESSLAGIDHETIFVDDGSTDGTLREMESASSEGTKVLTLGKRMGKSAAIYEGIMSSGGDIIATIDADLQNDPAEILSMLKEMENGFDMVCGWRHDRKDGKMKRFSSSVGNVLNRIILGIVLHDNNCPLKVFRRDCISSVRYFDNMHSFLPALAIMQGYRIKELRVSHYERIRGSSKYGVRNRIIGNAMATMTVKFRKRRLFI